MAALIELEAAKEFLNVLHNDDDTRLEAHIAAASEAVLAYLKSEGVAAFTDDDGEVVTELIPERVRLATVVVVESMYDPDPDREKEQPANYLPKAAISLLYSMRDPALA